MKKKWTLVVVSLVIVMMSAIAVGCGKSVQKEPLSQEEISKLREVYPVNDEEPPLVEVELIPFEDMIGICDCYAVAEVVSGPDTYDRRISPETTFTTYEVKIIDDIFDSISGDTMVISYNSLFDIGMPAMDVGARFVIGGVFDEKRGELNISHDIMFYVTDDGYVFSVSSEETRDGHTGSSVSELTEYIRTVKTESRAEHAN